MNKNYYDILGVSKTASTDEIKKAYKKLAMRYHPDRNKDNKEAEKKFKEINEAYHILSDPSKKKNYDQFGSADFSGFSGGGNPFGGYQNTQGGFDFGDIFSQFGEQRGGRKSQGQNFEFNFEDLFGGQQKQQSRQKREEPQEKNLDVTEMVEIPFMDFLFDTKVNVRTVYGKNLSLKVKAGTQPGTKFKIKGQGRTNGSEKGDMFVIVNAKMPKEIPAHIQKMVDAIRYEL